MIDGEKIVRKIWKLLKANPKKVKKLAEKTLVDETINTYTVIAPQEKRKHKTKRERKKQEQRIKDILNWTTETDKKDFYKLSELTKYTPILEKIEEKRQEYSTLGKEEIKEKSKKLREEIQNKIKETLEKKLEKLEKQIKKTKNIHKLRDLENKKEKQETKEIQKILEERLPEAYALTIRACEVLKQENKDWNIIPYQIQILGAIALNDSQKNNKPGKIIEMITGEGKTITAALPAYLNALTGRGVHIMTYNDYLAKRDAEELKPLYELLGVSVGSIMKQETEPRGKKRQEKYKKDILYGTLASFGFDLLRDRLEKDNEEKHQRKPFFAIIDEADALMIDEAKIPLKMQLKNAYEKNKIREKYKKAQQIVANLQGKVMHTEKEIEDYQDNEETFAEDLESFDEYSQKHQKKLMQKILEEELYNYQELEIEDELKEKIKEIETKYENKKNKKLKKIAKLITKKAKITEQTKKDITNKAIQKIAEDYIILNRDEKTHVILTRQGAKKIEKELKIQNLYDGTPETTEWAKIIENTILAKELYKKGEHYIVTEDDERKIILLDARSTDRQLPGRELEEGLQQALQAKEEALITKDEPAQTKITIQQYLMRYPKLAGMTGTATAAEKEFREVYGKEIIQIPTNKKENRKDLETILTKTKEQKWKLIAQEVKEIHDNSYKTLAGNGLGGAPEFKTIKTAKPILIGTNSIYETEKILENILTEFGIKTKYNREQNREEWKKEALEKLAEKEINCQLLNAENEKEEAEIIKEHAGKPNSIIIATNLAGRGTDIKLKYTTLTPEGIKELRKEEIKKEYQTITDDDYGLYVIGTERSESKRVDEQLRGRMGRQGDYGEARFYTSLEDTLIKRWTTQKEKQEIEKMLEENGYITGTEADKITEKAQEKSEEEARMLREKQLRIEIINVAQTEQTYRTKEKILEAKENNEGIEEILEEMAETITTKIMGASPYAPGETIIEKTENTFKEWGKIKEILENLEKTAEKIKQENVPTNKLLQKTIEYIEKEQNFEKYKQQTTDVLTPEQKQEHKAYKTSLRQTKKELEKILGIKTTDYLNLEEVKEIKTKIKNKETKQELYKLIKLYNKTGINMLTTGNIEEIKNASESPFHSKKAIYETIKKRITEKTKDIYEKLKEKYKNPDKRIAEIMLDILDEHWKQYQIRVNDIQKTANLKTEEEYYKRTDKEYKIMEEQMIYDIIGKLEKLSKP